MSSKTDDTVLSIAVAIAILTPETEETTMEELPADETAPNTASRGDASAPGSRTLTTPSTGGPAE